MPIVAARVYRTGDVADGVSLRRPECASRVYVAPAVPAAHKLAAQVGQVEGGAAVAYAERCADGCK